MTFIVLKMNQILVTFLKTILSTKVNSIL